MVKYLAAVDRPNQSGYSSCPASMGLVVDVVCCISNADVMNDKALECGFKKLDKAWYSQKWRKARLSSARAWAERDDQQAGSYTSHPSRSTIPPSSSEL